MSIGQHLDDILAYPEKVKDCILVDAIVIGRVLDPATGATRPMVVESPHTDVIVSTGLISLFQRCVSGGRSCDHDEDDD